MGSPDGCKIEVLSHETCITSFDWITVGKKPEFDCSGLGPFLLAHCYNGVTWGRFDENNTAWKMSSSVFPDLCPAVTPYNLLEMRLFGPEKEILIWRTDTGFSGRCLVDDENCDKKAPTAPAEEYRILLGDTVVAGPVDGFTRVSARTGAQQAVPLEITNQALSGRQKSPMMLKIRHYFEQDDQSGAVRIAATRLVDIVKGVDK